MFLRFQLNACILKATFYNPWIEFSGHDYYYYIILKHFQLKCGHVFHHHCCESILQKRWTGPRISFGYMFCCLCKVSKLHICMVLSKCYIQSVPMDHPLLNEVFAPSSKLYEEVKAKCNARLEYEDKKSCSDLTNQSSQWYKKPFEYAMHNYCYYQCYKCKEVCGNFST